VRETVLEFGCPYCAPLILADTTNDLAGFLCKRGEGLPEGMIWYLFKLRLWGTEPGHLPLLWRISCAIKAPRPASYCLINGSSLAGRPWATSAQSSSGMREGHSRSRTRDMLLERRMIMAMVYQKADSEVGGAVVAPLRG